MKTYVRALVFLAALFLAATTWAQTSGTVSGSLLDQTGAGIAGASVTAKNTATGATFAATADETGYFQFPVLPAGNYEITAEKSGFSKAVQKKVEVTVGARISLSLTMSIASQAESITITEETPLIETTRTQVSSTVNDRAVASLPVNGRNFIDFVLLTPGVTRDPRSGDISFAGQRGTLNSLTVDGSDNNNTFFGQTAGRTGSGRAPYQFSQDAVQEFQVNSNSYAAEFGRAGGAVINVITKSGSNDFHGTAFWFYRDRSMNATDLINRNAGRAKSPYHFNQFGGNVGGPIAKDRAFFFFDYDGQRNTQPNLVTLNLPTGFVATTAEETAALAYLTARANSWQRNQDQNVYLVKGDWHINPNHLFTARWNNQRFTGAGFENGGNQNSFEHTGASLVRTDTLTFSLTSSLSSNWVNVARVSWMRDKEPGQANSDNPEATVLQGGQTVLTVGRNFFSPRETTIKRWQWADNLAYARGRHTYKFGVDIVRDDILNFFPGNFSGGFRFDSLDNFGRSLAGLPLSGTGSSLTQAFAGSGTTGPLTNPDITELGFFAQDEWRPRSNLTVTYGLRYDQQRVAQPSTLNSAATLLAAGVRTDRINIDTNNWGPRVGVAWTPWSDQKLVIRSGYGLFHGRTPSILTGTAHSNNGINVQTLQFTSATTPVIPSYPNNICGAPTASPNCSAPAGGTVQQPIIFAFSPDFAQPLVQQFNFGGEYEFVRDWSVSISYLAVKGTHLPRTRDINLNANFVNASLPIAGTSTVLTFQQHTGARPIAGFGRILQFESTANSIYHGASFQVNKRFSRNYQLLASYTWGHAIDDTPDATAVVPGGSDDAKIVQYNPLPFLDRADSINDQRHRFVLSGAWDLNYAGGLNPVARAILGGWELSAIYTAQSGQPYSGLVNFDLNSDGNNRSDRTPGLPRNTFRLPSTFTLDPRVTRNFRVAEDYKLQFIFEAFNIFNHGNVYEVNRTQFSRSTSTSATGCNAPTGPLNPCLVPQAAFGTPVSPIVPYAGPRIIQLAAKFIF